MTSKEVFELIKKEQDPAKQRELVELYWQREKEERACLPDVDAEFIKKSFGTT